MRSRNSTSELAKAFAQLCREKRPEAAQAFGESNRNDDAALARGATSSNGEIAAQIHET